MRGLSGRDLGAARVARQRGHVNVSPVAVTRLGEPLVDLTNLVMFYDDGAATWRSVQAYVPFETSVDVLLAVHRLRWQ